MASVNDYIALGPFYHLRECKPIELPPDLRTTTYVIRNPGHPIIWARTQDAARAAEADRKGWLAIVEDSEGAVRMHLLGDTYKTLTVEAKA